MKKVIALLGIIVSLFPTIPLRAQTRTDWYIKNFESTVIVNKDSSLDIKEKIIADCGNLPDKHGIFRVLPISTKTEKGEIKTPIEIKSVSDFQNNRIHSYQTTKTKNSLTLKIGDPNKTVSGENYYEINYRVKNAVRHQADFSELYWNLNGNYWQLEIERFQSTIHLPAEITSVNAKVYLYSGLVGSKGNDLAEHSWQGNKFVISSKRTLSPGQGITLSLTMPTGIIKPYQPNWWEQYGQCFWLLLPLLILSICYYIWRRYGDDPNIHKTIVPEFSIPQNMSPMEMAVIYTNNKLKTSHLTAAIINLAVKKAITIEKLEKKGLLGQEDYLLKLNPGTKIAEPDENLLLKNLFKGDLQIKLSELKYKFIEDFKAIEKFVSANLKKRNYYDSTGRVLQAVLLTLGVVLLIAGFPMLTFSLIASLSLISSGLILLIFAFVMPRRTKEGMELWYQIRGFKLYMDTAEKYRQEFFEKENIYEKFLPYAIIFGIAKEWTKKMQIIYGEQYFKNYHPVWYLGQGRAEAFNIDSFTGSLNTITSQMNAATGTSSGSGGGGFSGGGGGGGGGGGW
jgi:uncharacterized membrane protein